ncbi:MAG TPA: hypothetical protein VGD67_21125 [Pseudonocardiaceae bacterium]
MTRAGGLAGRTSPTDPPAELAAAGVTCGLDVLALLADDAGTVPPVDTHTVTTAGGGTHLYYAAPLPPPPAVPVRLSTAT